MSENGYQGCSIEFQQEYEERFRGMQINEVLREYESIEQILDNDYVCCFCLLDETICLETILRDYFCELVREYAPAISLLMNVKKVGLYDRLIGCMRECVRSMGDVIEMGEGVAPFGVSPSSPLLDNSNT